MDYSYAWYDGARIASTSYDKDTGSSNALWDSTYAMDGLGRVASVDIDDGRRRTVSFAYAPEGQVLNRAERSSASLNPEDQRYFVAGRQVGELTSDGNGDPSQLDYATNLNSVRNWTPNPQSAPFRWNGASGITRGTFGVGAGYEAINPYGNGAQSTSGSYQVRDGETLQGIAASAWGDASLWYLIAEANGLSAGTQLIAGQNLILPDRVTNAHNSSDAFRVYDPNSALGDLSPTSAKPPKKPGACAVMGQILMVAIAVAVTAVTAGAGAVLSGAAPGLLSGMGAFATGASLTAGQMIAIGAAAGAAGSIASQGFGVATGLQERFNWKGVGMAAVAGGVSAGLGKFASLSQGGSIQGAWGKIGQAMGGGGFVGAATRGLAGNLLTQGVSLAAGFQDKFDWPGVAAAGLGAGLGGAFGQQYDHLGKFAGQAIAGVAGGTANAGIRSLLTGTSFGDNIVAALPDVVGSTIGNLVSDSVMIRPREATQTAVNLQRNLVEAQDTGYVANSRYNPNDFIVVTGSRFLDTILQGFYRLIGANAPAFDMSFGPVRSNHFAAAWINPSLAGATRRTWDIFRPNMPYRQVFRSGVPGFVEAAARHYVGNERVDVAIQTGRAFAYEITHPRPWISLRPVFNAIGAVMNFPIGERSLDGPISYTLTGERLPREARVMPITLGEILTPVMVTPAAWFGRAGALGRTTGAGAAAEIAIAHPLVGLSAREVVEMAASRGLQTERDSLILWSGLGPGGSARAQAFAREFGGTTLEMTPGGRWLESMDLYGATSPFTSVEADLIWGQTSARMVGQASGQVRSVLGQVRPDSVYRMYEIPAVQQNRLILGLDPLYVRPMLKASGY